MTDELKRLLELAGVNKDKVSVDSLGKKRLDERGQYWRQKMHRDMQAVQNPPVRQAPVSPEMEEGWLEDEGVPMGAHLPHDNEVVVIAFDDGDMEVEENDRDDAEYDYGHRRTHDPRDSYEMDAFDYKGREEHGAANHARYANNPMSRKMAEDHDEDDDEGMEDLKGQDRERWDRRRGTKGQRKSREDYDAERDEMYDSVEAPGLRFSYSVNQDHGIFIKDDREMKEAFLEGDEAYDCLSQLEMAGDDEKRVQVVLSQYDHRMQESEAGMLEAFTNEYNEFVREDGDMDLEKAAYEVEERIQNDEDPYDTIMGMGSLNNLDPYKILDKMMELELATASPVASALYNDDEYDDSMDGDHESALASAGLGTDEDYGGNPYESIEEGKKRDVDGDGDIDSDDYLAAKDKAIKKAKGKREESLEENNNKVVYTEIKSRVGQLMDEGQDEESIIGTIRNEFTGYEFDGHILAQMKIHN